MSTWLTDGQIAGQTVQWLNRIGRGNDRYWYEKPKYNRCNYLQYLMLRIKDETKYLEKQLAKETEKKYIKSFKKSIETGSRLHIQIECALTHSWSKLRSL